MSEQSIAIEAVNSATVWGGLITALVGTAIGAIIGTYGGVYFLHKKNEEKNIRIRKLAIRAIDFFRECAKKHNTFKTIEGSFNDTFNISQKRAILVLLLKLGIPILLPVNKKFNINKIEFLDKEINKYALDEIQSQINSGYCDNLFYLDIDMHYINELFIKTRREIALRYINEFMKYNFLNKEKNEVQNTRQLTELFSFGEYSMLQVFIRKNDNIYYYEKNGNINQEKLDKLKDDVKLGLWDKCFEWDIDAYENILEQRAMAKKSQEFLSQKQQPGHSQTRNSRQNKK